MLIKFSKSVIIYSLYHHSGLYGIIHFDVIFTCGLLGLLLTSDVNFMLKSIMKITCLIDTCDTHSLRPLYLTATLQMCGWQLGSLPLRILDDKQGNGPLIPLPLVSKKIKKMTYLFCALKSTVHKERLKHSIANIFYQNHFCLKKLKFYFFNKKSGAF